MLLVPNFASVLQFTKEYTLFFTSAQAKYVSVLMGSSTNVTSLKL